jgi:putative copper export protein
MYEIHIIATWLHIISAIYWIGAILFILTVLGPVMQSQPAGNSLAVLSEVQARVRRIVLLAILIFIITGVFNMHYRGLMDATVLFRSSYGRTFLLKMIPVAIMFTIYFSAPVILRKLYPQSKGACCEVEGGPKPIGKVFAILHIIALVCGLTAVLLGVNLRG